MNTPDQPVSRDVRRTIWSLLGFAVLAVLLAAVYRNHYLFQDPFGVGLPDLNMAARELSLGFQVGAALCVGWALLLGVLASQSGVRVLRDGWNRWVGAEQARPQAKKWAAALAIGYAAARWAANEETIHATLDMYTAGVAKTPFQYRDLVPWLVRLTVEGIPFLSADWVYAAFEALAAFGVYVAFEYLLRSFFDEDASRRLAALAVFVPLALNLATPYRYNAIYFPYDTPSVAFFTAGLALMLRREWWAYYPLFLVATVNRETTCFLAVGYLFVALGRERPSRIFTHVAAQAVLWIGVKAGLHMLYLENEALGTATGGLFSNQLARSGRILTAVPGLMYIWLITMGGAGSVVFLLRRRIRERRIQRIFGIVPVFFAGMIVVGELLEVRIYSELIPIVTLSLLYIMRNVARDAMIVQPALKQAVLS